MTTPRVRLQSMLVVLATTLALCLLTPSESGGQGTGKTPEPKYVPGEDHLKGKARWEWHLQSPAGKELDTGTFMGYVNGRICHAQQQKQVGTWKSTGQVPVSVTFTWPRLKGTWVLRLTSAKPPTYEGILKTTKKKGERLHVQIIND